MFILLLIVGLMFNPEIVEYWIGITQDFNDGIWPIRCLGIRSHAEVLCRGKADPEGVKKLYRLCQKGYEFLPGTIKEYCCNPNK